MRTFIGKIAYVRCVGACMMDNLERCGLSISASGDGVLYVDYEDLCDYLDGSNGEIETFLTDVYNDIQNSHERVCEIAFSI